MDPLSTSFAQQEELSSLLARNASLKQEVQDHFEHLMTCFWAAYPPIQVVNELEFSAQELGEWMSRSKQKEANP